MLCLVYHRINPLSPIMFYSVRAGTIQKQWFGESSFVTQVSRNTDFAVLRLDKAFVISPGYIDVIALPADAVPPPLSTRLDVNGWDDIFSSASTVTVASPDACHILVSPASKICVTATSFLTFCKGDKGGLVVSQADPKVLQGLTLYDVHCNPFLGLLGVQLPGVVANVRLVVPWITTVAV